MRRAIGVVCLACLAVPLTGATNQQTQFTSTEAQSALSERAILNRYCVSCHNDRLATGGLPLDAVDITNVGAHAEVWERVVGKLQAGARVAPPAAN